MKCIIKEAPPAGFLAWRDTGDEDWAPGWADLGGPPKVALHVALMEEQGFICCYCGRRIRVENSHVEHLVPRSKEPSLCLEYGNLLASCQKNIGKHHPRHCGMLKEDWYDAVLMVSPLNDDCEERFVFNAFGNIGPRNGSDAGARETIERLGLDINRLMAFRRKAIEGYLEILDTMSDEDIELLISRLWEKDNEGAFAPFCFSVVQVLSAFVRS